MINRLRPRAAAAAAAAAALGGRRYQHVQGITSGAAATATATTAAANPGVQLPRSSLLRLPILRASKLSRPLRSMATRSISFSAGSDSAALQRSFDALSKPNGKWALSDNGAGLERSFKFKTFKAAWTFMNDVAAECKSHKHHPEWSNVYNRVYVRWTTHSPPGLSEKDVAMAELCDGFARRDQSAEVDDGDGDIATLKSTADIVAAGAGDCCVPAGKSKEKQAIEAVEKEEGGQGSLAGVGGQPS